MRAIRFVEPWHARLEEVPEPDIREDEVLVRIVATGVCASDILGLSGRHPFRTLPSIPGHEGAGYVVRTGSAVSDPAPGDRVCIEPQRTCGNCEFCLSGMYQLCPDKQMLGTPAWPGTFAEYVAVPARTLYKLPAGVDFAVGAMMEPLAVATHTVRRLEPQTGRSYAVLGAGTIGILILLVLQASQEPSCSVVTDPRPSSRALALRLGATAAVDPTEPGALESTLSKLGRRWVDVAFSVVTLDSVVNQALSVVKPGGTVVEVATFGAPSQVDLRLLQTYERRMVGTVTYQRPDFEYALQLASTHQEQLRGLVTSELDLDGAVQYFNRLREARYSSDLKVMIYP